MEEEASGIRSGPAVGLEHPAIWDRDGTSRSQVWHPREGRLTSPILTASLNFGPNQRSDQQRLTQSFAARNIPNGGYVLRGLLAVGNVGQNLLKYGMLHSFHPSTSRGYNHNA